MEFEARLDTVSRSLSTVLAESDPSFQTDIDLRGIIVEPFDAFANRIKLILLTERAYTNG